MVQYSRPRTPRTLTLCLFLVPGVYHQLHFYKNTVDICLLIKYLKAFGHNEKLFSWVSSHPPALLPLLLSSISSPLLCETGPCS